MGGVRGVAREVRLRAVEDQDLEVFFEHQRDPAGRELSALWYALVRQFGGNGPQ